MRDPTLSSFLCREFLVWGQDYVCNCRMFIIIILSLVLFSPNIFRPTSIIIGRLLLCMTGLRSFVKFIIKTCMNFVYDSVNYIILIL